MDSKNRLQSARRDSDVAGVDTAMRRAARRAQHRTAERGDGKAIFGNKGITSKPLSTCLSEKSLQVALAAIEIYNKPAFPYREESFSILMANAWELILKAKWAFDHDEDETSLHLVDKKNRNLEEE